MTAPTPRAQPYTLLPLDTQTPHYKWIVTAILLIAGGTQTFAGNSVNLAIPRLMAAFGTDLATAQWVTTGFLITRTLVIPILGWLGGVVGNRNLFVAIMCGFTLCSIGCGLATSLPMLIFFRLLQGIVLGPMEGLTAVILIQAFPPHQRGLAVGLRTIGWSMGHITSFTLGGYFLQNMSWRLVFLMGVPTGILSAILGLLFLQQQRDYRNEPVDYGGLLSLGAFLVPLLLAISLARDDNTAVSTIALLALGALLGGALFVGWELWTAFPAVNLRLYRLPAFRAVCTAATLNNIGLFGAQFMVPIFLQQVMGFTPLQAGLVLVPALIISSISGVISGRLSDFMSPAGVAIGSIFALTSVFYLFSSVTSMTTVTVLAGYIILYRVCMFSTLTAITALNVKVLPEDQVRMGQGLLGVVRNIGASLGVTVASVLFERRRVWHQLSAYDSYNEASASHLDTVGEIKSYLHDAGIMGEAADRATLRLIRQQMNVEAIASGFRDNFLMICISFFLASFPLWWLAMRRSRPAS